MTYLFNELQKHSWVLVVALVIFIYGGIALFAWKDRGLKK